MATQSLAPTLLLAAPRLADPNFERRVVLLGKHEPDGALGWVLNGPALDPVGQLLQAADLVPAGVQVPRTAPFRKAARVGGPVTPESGWLIYPNGGPRFDGEIEVGEELLVCSNAAALDAVVRGREPRQFRLVLGYAGWDAGQLEAELREGVWLPAALEPSLVFETDPDSLWDVAFQQATGGMATTFNGKTWGLA
ncbi:YqgE/AlgH family protein [Vulgatibacter sp.]|uniref:YqgE/AlgH family protein n=1 Tax=Vulgatibacter sp. TaxID=1971226 RepID=UPI003563191A